MMTRSITWKSDRGSVGLCLLIILLFGVTSEEIPVKQVDYDSYYPQDIPIFPVRKDVYTGQPVTTGRMHLVGGIPDDIRRLKRDPNGPKYSLEEFRKHLQCSPTEPNLNEFTGSIALLRLIPPQKHTVELMCAWAETHCEPWSKCEEYCTTFKAGKYPPKFEPQRFDFLQNYRLLRILNGSLYYDWPWGTERLHTDYFVGEMLSHYTLLEMTTSKLTNLPDSVFFFGSERPFLPWNFPFPAFSFAPALGYNNMPWPWFEAYEQEWKVYKHLYPDHLTSAVKTMTPHRRLLDATTNPTARKKEVEAWQAANVTKKQQHLRSHYETLKNKHPHLHQNFAATLQTTKQNNTTTTTTTATITATSKNTPKTTKNSQHIPKNASDNHQHSDSSVPVDAYDTPLYAEYHHHVPWTERIPKAAFYASCDRYRQWIFEQSRHHPQLLDTHYHFHPYCTIYPLNPLSPETPITDTEKAHGNASHSATVTSWPAGFAWPLVYLGEGEKHYVPGKYKYIITMLGTGAQSTSGRLAALVAHSGAVVLLSRSAFVYHFSAQLQPWVHYVPISYTGADIVEKITWLQAHEAEAQRIVRNARQFARSYLRLEDYYCYAANALSVIGDIYATAGTAGNGIGNGNGIGGGEEVTRPFNATQLYV